MKSEIEALLEERSKTHGPYPEFADCVQAFKFYARLYGKQVNQRLSNQHQEALDMIFHKIGRIVTGNPNVKDHWDDLAGYATLGAKAVKDDGIKAVKSEGPQTTETQKPLGQGLTYPEVQTPSGLLSGIGVQAQPFKGDVTG